MAKKLSWSEKLENGKPHYIKTLDKNFAGMKAGQIMLIPSTKLIDNFIQKIPKGKAMSIVDMRNKLAKKHKADVTCPVATGFVLKTVAEAAFEKHNEGQRLSAVTPVWRVLNADSPTLKKLSFDTEILLKQRKLEKLD